MNQFIESLARLYKTDRITVQTLDGFLSSKKITREEYEYILAVKNDDRKE